MPSASRNATRRLAVTAGLASEMVEAESFDATVTERLAEFAEKDGFAFGVTKGYLRGSAVASMRDRDAALLDEFLDGCAALAREFGQEALVAGVRGEAAELVFC